MVYLRVHILAADCFFARRSLKKWEGLTIVIKFFWKGYADADME